jgi:hypothetical protein
MIEAADAPGLDGPGHLAGDGFRGAEVERTVLDLGLEFRAAQRRPPALGAEHASTGEHMKNPAAAAPCGGGRVLSGPA